MNEIQSVFTENNYSSKYAELKAKKENFGNIENVAGRCFDDLQKEANELINQMREVEEKMDFSISPTGRIERFSR